ncbi:LpxL/LpxP family Kdo(2)-lipid IV(A) lauroyl/palmitoleoyl acyltransferase [Thioalkalivibrio sp. XN279]|uniref:LpxL/LpxP family Kdo(2)-lipid IV(A) lauroyl/palmitoleoyl acyltransferase n=1 Tax=Thioalkalivibrio sp. XN279 TaxID=2714953 RepID=UPI00140A0EA6|nr:LpxL/LpxP family Kdo(2)-lipid IV(A) lauroyl/palmitoleoyl acyltransferase [Thioalkalivibrio sp. XN279]NHA16138.1 LpxL/LpxP family Kdo(2)-lipid IV(A) lauroyl/palmitoleoyl acyltransferase [Thioalkalivibrio sp. XN279]
MSSTSTPLYRFLAPRYWPVWLALGAVRLLVALPYGAQRIAGRIIGRTALVFARQRRAIAARNLELAFPELDAAARRELLRRHFESLGMSIIETGMCWWASDARISRLVEVSGLEHAEAALAAGHGAIMLTGHFTTLDLGGRFLTRVAPVSAMYRPHRNPLFEEIMRRGRERSARQAFVKTDVRAMIRALRTNHLVWYAPDQAHKRGKYSAVVPFFGVPAPTNTATSAFARLGQAPVIPFFPVRLPGRGGYRLEILPPLKDFPGSDPDADALRINHLLEERIRLCPEQYLWVHRRFKPAGAAGEDHYGPLGRKRKRRASA